MGTIRVSRLELWSATPRKVRYGNVITCQLVSPSVYDAVQVQVEYAGFSGVWVR